MAEPNFKPSTIWTGDNLSVMRGMNSECVDLIYLDPPFNSNRTYEAPIGSRAAGASFKDAWTLDDVDAFEHGELADRNPAAHAVIEAARQAHGKSMQSYLIFMAVRLLEMRRILKPMGSIWLHCDDNAAHYLKLLMDAAFGRRNFRNDLIWRYGGSARGAKAIARHFARNSDNLLYYAKDRKAGTHNPVRGARRYPPNALPSHIEFADGRYFKTAPRGDYTDASVERLRGEGRIYETRTGKIRIKYFLDCDGEAVIEPTLVGSVWDIPDMMHAPPEERQGYPAQKPLALLERVVLAGSNEGDLVLDPFCGCATTLVAADRLQRRWAGIDLSPLAIRLVDERIAQDRGDMPWGGANALTDPPRRTDLGELPNYRTHRHRLYGEQEGVCAGCDTHFPFRVMEVDRSPLRTRGGADRPDNLQLLCSHCNRSKGGKTMAEWKAARGTA